VNQDHFLLSPLESGLSEAPPACLLAVADGIGGGPAGDRASGLAVRALREFVWRAAADPDLARSLEPGDLLRKAVLHAHDEILYDVAAHPERNGMGSTLTAALLAGPYLWIAHVGDSRAYLLRGSRLGRLTIDHLVADRMVEEGILSSDAARHSAWRRTLWNHLGMTEPMEPEVATARLEPGDALLLTTDGITDSLGDRDLEALCQEAGSAQSLAAEILRSAKEAGGRDDMTLVLARFVPPPAAEPALQRIGRGRAQVV
jgi:protein phosphatase